MMKPARPFRGDEICACAHTYRHHLNVADVPDGPISLHDMQAMLSGGGRCVFCDCREFFETVAV